MADGDLGAPTALGTGFGRMQINVPRNRRRDVARQAGQLAAMPGHRIVLQHEDPWNTMLVVDGEHLEYLFDASGGRGEQTFGRWPAPPPETMHRRGHTSWAESES